MSWETVIGLEVHAQLSTKSKIFSGSPTAYGASPNSQASLVDLAYPGVLPVLNQEVVRMAVKFGLAIGATIAPKSVFARKNYFYPDLPKGYQISQYEVPIVQGGYIEIPRKIRITRAHLEEDAGKSLHEMFHGMTGIDLNRAGTPLLEIVSEPDLRGAQEAAAYARALHRLVTWIGICDGNMQEGSFRCDANVSVRRPGERLGTRCEIKNLNSFRFMEHAIEFEARRQIEILEAGGTVEQETRLYDPERDETRSLRTKEEAHDYRYFPDPDLLPLVVEQSMVDELRRTLPELPDVKRARYVEMGVAAQAAELLVASRESAEFYERALATGGASEATANLMTGELAALLNDAQTGFSASLVSPEDLALVQRRVADGTISGKISKELLKARFDGETASIDALIERRGLRQISDAAVLEQLVDEVLAKNEKQVADYRAGRDKAFHALVGQVMKATRGKANPVQVSEILRKKLKT